MFQENDGTLRCVWVPAHASTDAPLSAIWINTPQRTSLSHVSAVTTQAEGDSWACAA
jgi:hypothetical protein